MNGEYDSVVLAAAADAAAVVRGDCVEFGIRNGVALVLVDADVSLGVDGCGPAVAGEEAVPACAN